MLVVCMCLARLLPASVLTTVGATAVLPQVQVGRPALAANHQSGRDLVLASEGSCVLASENMETPQDCLSTCVSRCEPGCHVLAVWLAAPRASAAPIWVSVSCRLGGLGWANMCSQNLEGSSG